MEKNLRLKSLVSVSLETRIFLHWTVRSWQEYFFLIHATNELLSQFPVQGEHSRWNLKIPTPSPFPQLTIGTSKPTHHPAGWGGGRTHNGKLTATWLNSVICVCTSSSHYLFWIGDSVMRWELYVKSEHKPMEKVVFRKNWEKLHIDLFLLKVWV
jgi:hypothetical protein